ncbi:MAG: peptidoglycan DD-metalloendopeptidase family protein [Bacteroidota bacterium]|jgi:murein DD-endopeptidase MepM/ murein hydrolase activator NlpD
MPKAKYYFNTHSLKYERVIVPLRKRILRVVGFLATAMVFSTLIVLVAYSYLDSPKEKQLKREIAQLELQYEILQERMDEASIVLSDMQNRDDNIYRVIFEAEPIPATVRGAGYGGVDRYRSMDGYGSSKLMIAATRKLDKLTKQMYVQSKSFDEIVDLAKDKTEMLASIPAIQPISNKELNRMSSGFGYRIHPIYKTSTMHAGMDFAAPIGTPIYATGNGVVKKAEFNPGGYGNHVVISHGFGYETLYAHMNSISVKSGQRVTRGDVIGELGNTGSSTGPHLHYEVIRGGTKVDPIRYFFNDLTPEEYDRLIQLAAQSNQSFD